MENVYAQKVVKQWKDAEKNITFPIFLRLETEMKLRLWDISTSWQLSQPSVVFCFHLLLLMS